MAEKSNVQLSREIIEEAKKRALGLESTHGKRMEMFRRYREIFFLQNVEKPKNSGVDDNDWKVTADPSGRNEVVGLKRLLDTSELHVTVKVDGDDAPNSSEIERGLKKMLDVSGEGRKSRVESDAMLAAVLYGPVILSADFVGDLLSVPGIPEWKKRHLIKVGKKTPFLIRAHNPEESYVDHDDGMIIHFHRKYRMTGAQVKARYGKEDCRDNIEYEIRDIFTPEYHIVFVNNDAVFAKEHKLNCVPVAASYAGGTELFFKPEEQIQSFLYAKAEAELDKFGNSLLTTMRTAIHMRGLGGPMLAVDPDTAPETIHVDYTGGVRIIKAKAQPVDEKIVDPVIFQAKNLLDDLSGQSTMYRQTLGENINASTFSSLAMLSSSGKLPMIDAQRALEAAFTDLFDTILYRMREEGLDGAGIEPSDIPADYELLVTFEPKLPQDNLRNAQVAASLGPLVSDEWKHTNLLQVGDSEAMFRQVAREQMRQAIIGNMMQDPNLMQQFTAMVMGQQPGQGQPQPGQGDPMQQGQGQMPQEEMPSEEEMMMMAAQGQGQGMERPPMTEQMIPPTERM